jgi:transposase-like protein
MSTPRVITVDKNAAYPKAFKELKAEEIKIFCNTTGTGAINCKA